MILCGGCLLAFPQGNHVDSLAFTNLSDELVLGSVITRDQLLVVNFISDQDLHLQVQIADQTVKVLA